MSGPSHGETGGVKGKSCNYLHPAVFTEVTWLGSKSREVAYGLRHLPAVLGGLC